MIDATALLNYPSLVESACLTLAICFGFEWKERRK